MYEMSLSHIVYKLSVAEKDVFIIFKTYSLTPQISPGNYPENYPESPDFDEVEYPPPPPPPEHMRSYNHQLDDKASVADQYRPDLNCLRLQSSMTDSKQRQVRRQKM